MSTHLRSIAAWPVVLTALAVFVFSRDTRAQTLEQQLMAEEATSLAQAAREVGDAKRGAILFFQPHMACWKCHAGDDPQRLLGPDLSRPPDPAEGADQARIADQQLIQA